MIKYTGFILCILFCRVFTSLKAQYIDNFCIASMSQNSLYIICRGTGHKFGEIADKFNIKDRNITHAGIGIIQNNELKIYNVNNDDQNGKTALLIESTTKFLSYADIKYFGIWEFKSNALEINKLSNLLKKIYSKKIIFDMEFNDKNDDKLYCSEFCVKILRKLNPSAFNYKQCKKELTGFYKMALDRDVLYYYPVDFFQKKNNFSLIFQKFYNP